MGRALHPPVTFDLSPRAWRTILPKGIATKPLALRNAVAPLPEARIFGAIVAACDALREGSPLARIRLSFEHQGPRGQRFYSESLEPRPLLPTTADGSVAGWVNRLTHETGGLRFALIVNDLHVFDDEVWRATWPLFRTLFGRLGAPAGYAYCDLFLGNYHRTPFGIHKDDQYVFTYPVVGRKRFHLWPFKALINRPETRHQEDLANRPGFIQVRDEAEYRELLARSSSIDAGPGDVMFWPPSYWHCADNPDGSLALTVSPGFTVRPESFRTPFVDPVPLADAWRDAKAAVQPRGAVPPPRRLLSRAESGPDTSDAAERLAMRWLTRQTGLFFRTMPPEGEMPALSPDTVLQGVSPLAWTALEPTRWLLSGAGHAVPLEAPAVVLARVGQLCATLNQGAATPVAALLAPFSGRLASSRQAAAQILAMTVAWRAVRVVAP